MLQGRKSPLNIAFVMQLYDASPNSFYYWPEQGTWVISNICHHLDLAYPIIGVKPVSVSSTSSTVGRKDEDVVVTATFEDGSLCTILAENRGDSSIPGEEKICIMCDGLTIDIWNYSELYARKDGKEIARWKGKRDDRRKKSLASFINGIARNQAVPYPDEDIYWSGITFLKADIALKTGQLEKINYMEQI
jgi:hypothetical protein